MLSFQEAIYHAVPLLCLPFGNDQKGQASKAEREGFGIKMDWNDFKEEQLNEALNKLINDHRCDFYVVFMYLVLFGFVIQLQLYL